jgi:DNA segregation ATPase FtsK/SpoIIIE, S-DNA-T family
MNRYNGYTPDELQNVLSGYLIESWSYSKVNTFARNEKQFEKSYVYLEPDKRSVTSIAGNAYHEALKSFFEQFNEGEKTPGLVALTQAAYDYIDNEVGDNDWRLTDSLPTVDQAKEKCITVTTALLENFCAEYAIYTQHIGEVLSVEEKDAAFVVCNGVDIPLPLHYIADLVIRTKDGKTVIIDHKSKGQYTSDDEVALVHGQQAMTYVLGYEQSVDDGSRRVDEVWFIENKYSKNRDKSEQLRLHRFVMDEDSRKLYEFYLYQPLRRMLEAVSDPDYIYTINAADNLADKAELYEFSARTLIAEVDDFPNIPDSKRPLIEKRQRKIKDSSIAMISPRVIRSFRKSAASFITFDYSHSNMTNKEKIEHKFRTFGKQVQVTHEIEGYSCNTYLCEVAAGIAIDSLKTYAKDIAYALDVPSVRIAHDLVVYEGRSFLSIEVNKKRTETLEWDASLLEGHKIPLGKDNFKRVVTWDMDNHSTPHMLVCGATGSGKSVLIRSTIAYAMLSDMRVIIMDPKYEFTALSDKCEVWNDIADIERRMKELVEEMQGLKGNFGGMTLIVFDEFADAVSSARSGKELDIKEEVIVGEYKDGRPKKAWEVVGREKSLEENMKMLLQKGRSLGYRIVAATQRASAKVITGDAKVNFPCVCCFRVPKALDSKVVIDEDGAQALAGGGDGLFKSPEHMDCLVRFQGFFYKG